MSTTLCAQQLLHTMIDGYHGDTLALDDPETVQYILRRLQKLMGPSQSHVLYYPAHEAPDMRGVTGFALSVGQHATIHTYSDEQRACYFSDMFGLGELDLNLHVFGPCGSALHDVFSVDRKHQVQLHRGYQPESYGPHLLLQSTVQQHLSPEQIQQVLTVLPPLIGMTPLITPVLVESEAGVSGIIIIAESHIALHWNAYERQLQLDVFSCKSFDTALALQYLGEQFPMVDTTHMVLSRGLFFDR